MNAPGVLIYIDDIKDLQDIASPAEIGELLLALVKYAETGEDTEDLAPSVLFPYRQMKRKIANNESKYSAISEKRRQASNTRWKKKPDADASPKMQMDTNASSEMQMDANAFSEMQMNPNALKEKETENQTENETEERENALSSPKPAQKKKTPPKFFEEFWAAYPKRQGRGDAEKAFAKHKVDAGLLQTMLAAIHRSEQTPQWQRDNGQFIPMPSTWLNQRRWEDDPEIRIQTFTPQPTKTVSAQAYTQRAYTEHDLGSWAESDLMREAMLETND